MLKEQHMSLVGPFTNAYVTLHSLTRIDGGWTTDIGQYFPKWQDIENPLDPLVIYIHLNTCQCEMHKMFV